MLDLDDLPLSRLVSASTSGDDILDGKPPVEAGTPGVKVPVSSPSDGPSDLTSTPPSADGHPGKVRTY